MSRYAKLIIISLLCFLPKLAFGKTISDQTSQWTINPTIQNTSATASIRGFDLKNLSEHVMLGQKITSSAKTLDQTSITQINDIATQINQPVQNAQLVLSDNVATTFVPDKIGESLDSHELLELLASPFDTITLPVVTSQPETKLSDLNSLGINELVAEGVSDFTGSTKNRLVNITVGASKYNGVVVDPGAEFSFNQILGDVDAAHGFKPELVIKASGVVPEFGGGLCQVSTTMFRAAMNAGFPITARRNHSFAVKFYAPQGTDATIYPGVSDLKFVNNLASHVLIATHIDGNKLYFDVYGTKDNRVVTFDGPHTYDRQSNGALKAVWTRDVTINGQKTEQVFNSNYLPPSEFEGSEADSTPNPQAKTAPTNSTTQAPTT